MASLVEVERALARIEPPRFKLKPFAELTVGSESVYLVKGLIPRTGLTVVWGPPKCGKSFWVFDVAMHVALGWEYRGRRVRQGPVVYFAFEGAHGFNGRAEAFRQRFLSEDYVLRLAAPKVLGKQKPRDRGMWRGSVKMRLIGVIG